MHSVFVLQVAPMTGHISRIWQRQRISMRFALLTVAIIGIWFGMLHEALSNSLLFGQIRGGTADWLSTTEALKGTNAYEPVSELALEHLGWRGAEPDSPHPRPPSALLLLLPLSLVPPDLTLFALMMISAAALVYWVQSSVRWLRASTGYELLVIPFCITLPVLQGVVWGGHTPIVAAAIGASLVYSRGRITPARGVFIGIASALKVFPFIAVFTQKEKIWMTLTGSISALLVLSVGGLLLPGVEAARAFAALFGAPGHYENSIINMSVSYHFGGETLFSVVLVVVATAAVILISKRADPWITMSATLIIMVLISPLAWPEYLVLAFPALLLLTLSGTRTRLIAFMAWGAMVFTTDGTTLLVLCVALVLSLALPESRRWAKQTREACTQLPGSL